jgi:hypothetical protein
MTKLLTVIPFSKQDGALAEKLCDWIFFLNNRQSRGHALIVASGDVHPEMATKVQLAAEVAFETAAFITDKTSGIATQPKAERINKMFLAASNYVSTIFEWPFLWLEPDCVPLKPQWLEMLFAAYEEQPKRYLGSVMKSVSKEKEEALFPSRVAIYPNNAADDLRLLCNKPIPFNIAGAELIMKMQTKCSLLQQFPLKDESDKEKIRPGAVLFHGDKKGQLIGLLRDELKPEPEVGEAIPIRSTARATRTAP